MTQEPLVSILILAYNHQSYIEECLESYLNTNYKNLEVIILDNGSSDKSYETMLSLQRQEKYKDIKILRAPKGGLGVNAGFNGLLKEATGKLVCFTSADDYTFAGRIEEQIKAFCENTELKAYYAIPSFFEDKPEGRVFWQSPLLPSYKKTIALIQEHGLEFAKMYHAKENPFYMIGIFCLQASMFDREFVLGFGGFDENNLADDIIFNFRLFNKITSLDQVKFTNDEVIGYRQHSDQTHKNFIRQSQLLIGTIDSYIPEKIKNTVMADVYFYNVDIGFRVYWLKHFSLVTSYLFKSLKHEFKLYRIILYFYLIVRATIMQILGRKIIGKIKKIICGR